MASLELILSESEWQNLLSFRGYVKQLFEVDIRRKDEFYHYHDCNNSNSASPSCVQEPLSASPEVTAQSRSDLNSNSSRFFPSNLLISKNGVEDGQCTLHPSPVVIVQLQTESSSPSNLEKCQKFAIAFSPSNPDFKSITINLDNQHHFNMVKAYLPSIQQSTSTLINCPPNSTDITIQGHHSCVELAQHQVDLILQSCKTKSLEIQCENQHNLNSNHSSVGTATVSTKDNKNDPNAHHSVHSQHLSSLKTNNVTTSPAKSDDSVFFSSNEDYGNQCEDLYNFSALSNLVQEEENENLVYSPVVNDVTLPFKAFTDSYQQKDFNDLEEDKILSDGRFSNRIDQATKLGFSEEQVLKVLRRLGVNSSMDDMMRELVSFPQGVNTEEGMMSLEDFDSNETKLLSRGEDSDDSDGFDVNDSSNLRHIIIDGSNVAMSHGQKVFSCLGIKIVVDWFKNRGHKNITAFVPQWRKEASRPDAPITNQEILTELEEEKIVVFTPSRRVGGTRIVCYDDRFVLQLAVKMDGIVVSNDIYRDLVRERDDFKEVVEKRLLMYSFVQDMFMPPEDPLGRQGPSLDNFLRIRPSDRKNKPEICPYGKKCTFGNKCRFYHPERRYASQKMVAERLREHAELKQKSIKTGKSVESTTDKARQPKQKLSRTLSLFPQDAVDTIPSDSSKRPPLHHSKSLIYPSSYLSDLRLKMEEAESAEAVQEPSTLTMAVNYKDSSSDQIQTIETDSKDGSKSIRQYSSSCNPSPRTSPSPKSDSMKMEVKATRSYPSSPAPNVPPSFTVSDAKSSINIPNPEPQDRYLSGHVLVAKRLSDEDNSSGQFFLQHTSRAPGLLQQENQNLTLSGSLHSSDSNSSPVLPSAKVSNWNPGKESQEPSLWNVTDVYLPPKITNPVYHHELVRRGSNPSSIVQQEMKGNSSPGHSPNISRSDQCDSCPTFSKKDEDYGLQHQNFRRSYSTSTPAYSGEFMNLGRKFSLNTTNIQPMENVHAKVKPHSSVPLSERAPYNQYHSYTPTIKPQLQRSKMSFDSGISSGGLCVDQPISSNAPFSPTEFSSVPFRDVSNVSSPGVFSPSNQNPMQFVTQQQQPEVMYNPNPAGYAASSSPWQYSPLPNRMLPFQDQGIQSQNFVMPLSNVTPNSQNPPMFNRPPATFTTMANYTSPPPYQPQSYVQPAYQSAMPNAENKLYPMNMYGGGGNSMPYSPSTPSSPYQLHPPPIQPHAKVIDEEAEIRVDDPRYSIYYHLSSLFGERVVKTFMNRNPDVKNFKELYTLISSYKQDTMM